MTDTSGTQDTLLDGPLELRRPDWPTADVELEQGAVVGRYVVLARVGAGGMGVVYAVYDPELDRKIALKLLHADYPHRDASDGDRRLLFEAKAMAKLSHPNVITVHDVGEHRGRIYVAMEFVEGSTLAAWRKITKRSWPEVLEVFVAAGRGLSAAHHAGLVHRDFKPDNVMVGADDRVRVMDFGLAHSNDAIDAAISIPPRGSGPTDDGTIMGTPAYMSPEQHLGTTVGAAADQFSFCVALWELLYGQRPFAGQTMSELAMHVTTGERRPAPARSAVPSWLRKVCERGLAPRPEDRFASMDALLVALQRGHRRARVRTVVLAVAGVALLGLGVQAYRSWGHAQQVARCQAEGANIEITWNANRAASLRDALSATPSESSHSPLQGDFADATTDKMMPWLDAQATAWADARSQACTRAHIDGTWDADTLSRAEWCLDERRTELDALVTELTSAEGRGLQRAVHAAATLEPVEPCLHAELLHRLPAPPAEGREALQAVRAELLRASALDSIGAYDEGLVVARDGLRRAEELAWPPLVAASRLRIGTLLDRTGSYEESEKTLEDAFFGASSCGAVETAFEALIALVYTVGVHGERPDDALRWARYLEVVSATLPDPAGLRAASRLGSLAIVKQKLGDHEEARALLEEATSLRVQALGDDNPEVARSLANLAEAHFRTGDLARARSLLERSLAIQEQALGREHPDVAFTLNNLANVHQVMGTLPEAKTLLERTLAIQEAVLGPEHPHVALSSSNLAALLVSMGEHAEARKWCERALAIREKALGADHPDVARSLTILANIHRETGQLEQARPLYERARSILERALGPDHVELVPNLQESASVYFAAGDHAEARALGERALAILERTVGPDDPRVAVSLVALADLALAQQRNADAVALAQRAITLLEAKQPDSPLLQQARALLTRASP
jgi:serine/threonine protein kinase/tetratricopeptide (TPR) repeat protein